jgi:Predicted hydrolase of the metallo-beta-lactamase superfamily
MPHAHISPNYSATKTIIGPFELDFIRVSHSVVDCVGLAIQTPVGCIIHSGDFKLTPTTIEGGLTDINANLFTFKNKFRSFFHF